MNSSDSLAKSAAGRISTAFDIVESVSLSEHDVLREIRLALVEKIIQLLNSNPERLMAILYRIDVREAVVNEIFATALAPDVPDLIADLIIERQLAKARTRAEHARTDGNEE